MKLKICGVNDATFARAAEAGGADYLGFIFAPRSPRFVQEKAVAAIVATLDGHAKKVGVFVDTPAAEAAQIAARVGLDVIQLHRRATVEDVKFLREEGFEVWTLAGGASGDGVLFDSSHGDGERVLRKGPWMSILAGGISADNVAAAVASGADVIDVSGSLETSPGVKSVALLDHFLEAFRFCLLPPFFPDGTALARNDSAGTR